MRPSIMSDGAMMSAPAAAWMTAAAATCSTVSSLTMMPSRRMPSWPWLVNGSSAPSVMTPISGTAALIARVARLITIVGVEDVRAGLVAQRRGRHWGRWRSPECRALPRARPPSPRGRRSCGRRRASPRSARACSRRRSRRSARSGRRRVSRFSCTSRRDQSALRMRRSRRLPVISSTLRWPAALRRLILFMARSLLPRLLARVVLGR